MVRQIIFDSTICTYIYGLSWHPLEMPIDLILIIDEEEKDFVI